MFASAVENAEMERKIQNVNNTTICIHIGILLTGYFDRESAVYLTMLVVN